MSLRSVDDDRAQAELLRDAQRGENVVRAVRMKMRLDAAVQHREQRLHLAVVIRLLMVVVYLGARLAREIFTALVQLVPDERGGRHARDRGLVLVVVDRLRIFAEGEFHRERCLDDHVVDAPAGGLDERDLAADGVRAAGRNACRRHAGLERLAEGVVHRVDRVDGAHLRRDGVGILVAVRALEAQTVLIQTEVGMDVDEAGRQHAALAVEHLAARRGLALAERVDFSVFQQNPTEKPAVFVVHCQNGYIFDQNFFHENLRIAVDRYGIIWYIYHGSRESCHAPFISLSPHFGAPFGQGAHFFAPGRLWVLRVRS